MSILDKQIVLSLNSAWSPIGWRTVRQAIISLSGGDQGHPAVALDMLLDSDGNLVYVNPVEWEAWCELPVREGDLAISTAFTAIRAPTAIVSRNYSKTPLIKPSLSNESIFERDGFRDQYTGELLERHELSVDHVIPKAKGGAAKCWKNMVTCKKRRNHDKGDKLNHEIGLSLIRAPYEPKHVPISVSLGAPKRPEHAHFLIRK